VRRFDAVSSGFGSGGVSGDDAICLVLVVWYSLFGESISVY
jgi:hypothetical protein